MNTSDKTSIPTSELLQHLYLFNSSHNIQHAFDSAPPDWDSPFDNLSDAGKISAQSLDELKREQNSLIQHGALLAC